MSNQNISQVPVSFYTRGNMRTTFVKIIFSLFLVSLCLYGYFFFYAKAVLDIGNITILDRNYEIIAQI